MGLQAKELAAAMRQIPASPTQVGGKPTPGKGSVVGGIVVGAAATAGAAAIFSSDDVDEASKEAEKAGEKVGTSFGEGVANTAGTVVEYGAYAAVFAGFTALATKIVGLLAASGLWASITAGFSTGFAAIGTAIAGFAASLAAAVLSPVVAVAGVIAAAITAPLAVEAALVVAEAKKAEKDAERAQKRQDRAVKTFAALRTETEAVTSAIASANERMSGFAAQLASTAEKADESKYAVLSLSKLLETLGKTKDLGTADDILTEINKRADAVRANVEKTQKDALAAFTAYAERIKKLGADINPTELIFGKEDIQSGTAKVKSALKEREAEVRAALKRNRQLAGQIIKESNGDTSGSQEILNTLAARSGELQGQLKEIRAAQDELDAKVTTELSKALGESTDAALAAEAELRAIAQRARDRLARQADQANQRVVDDLSTDVTAFLTGAEDVNNKLIAELEQKRTNFINNLTKALERPGLTAEKRATLAALLEKVTGDEFVKLAEETIGTEIRKRVNLKLTDIKEAVDNFFEGVELEQRFKDFEQRVAQTEKKIKLDALTDDIEDLTKKRGKLTELADAFSELEDLRLSGVSEGLKTTEKVLTDLEAPTLKYLDTIDKLILAFTGLEDSSVNAFKAIKDGAEGAKQSLKQDSFNFGLQAGKDTFAAQSQTKDTGTFLRQSSTARDLVSTINSIRRRGGDEAEQGKKIGEAIAAAQDKLSKQGRADDPNAKAFFDRLNSDLGDLFTDPERTTPEEELRKSVEAVGEQTNTLLTSIDASLQALTKGQIPDTANLRSGIAQRRGADGTPTGSSAAIEGSKVRGIASATDRELQGRETNKTALE
uniref:Uncharacterized protein n=1 Tax=Biomphalaria glabrata TaxID=6526 RepID=A0A2C9LKW5_BIOGL